MRIDAIIASAILAATVSGAALPVPAAVAAPTAVDKAKAGWNLPFRPYGLPIGDKREATPEAGWKLPSRPYGLPIPKREAEAEADWKLPKRPFGLPIHKREAEAEAGWKLPKRPFGLPISKRGTDATEETGEDVEYDAVYKEDEE